ncbi:unnamed protein product [Meganyctiphanes norvegica]|uniref:DNA-directed RNA polymerase subunit n=1 Tax=Meganyctiphanes norvegica TaxID=48144 RepID=A0AAV2QFL5_MEGNR
MSFVSEVLFTTDPDFCPSCGAILSLPTTGDIITCKICTTHMSLKELENKETNYSIEFTPLGAYQSSQKKKDEEAELGQMDNERECSKCGNIGMSYTTMQLRSADEGQTVFYICPKCKHREVENS